MKRLFRFSVLILLFTITACSNTVKGKRGEAHIVFDELIYDYGKVTEGKRVSHTFKFTNTGGGSLIIESVFSSCGCTVGEYTKDTIRPGSKGEIFVTFDSRYKSGFQHKSVTINSNSNPPSQVLVIKADVIP